MRRRKSVLRCASSRRSSVLRASVAAASSARARPASSSPMLESTPAFATRALDSRKASTGSSCARRCWPSSSGTSAFAAGGSITNLVRVIQILGVCACACNSCLQCQVRHNRHTRQRGLALFCVVLLKDCEPEELVPNQNFAIAAYKQASQSKHARSQVPKQA